MSTERDLATLRELTRILDDHGGTYRDLAEVRRYVIIGLREEGVTLQTIADATGLTRARIAQLSEGTNN